MTQWSPRRYEADLNARDQPIGVILPSPLATPAVAGRLASALGDRGNLDRHGVHFLTAYVAGV